MQADASGLVAQTDGKVITEKLESIKGEVQYAGTIEWFGQADKYFTATHHLREPGSRYEQADNGARTRSATCSRPR